MISVWITIISGIFINASVSYLFTYNNKFVHFQSSILIICTLYDIVNRGECGAIFYHTKIRL